MKFKKSLSVFLGLLLCFLFVLDVSNASELKAGSKLESVVELNAEVSDVISISDTEKMWVEDDTIYKMEIELNKPTESGLSGKASKLSADANVTIYNKHIDDTSQDIHAMLVKQYVKDRMASRGVSTQASQIKSDQAWDDSYTIRLTLSVNYSNQNNRLYLYSATGTYDQFARNGIVVNSGVLGYSATGSIYRNNVFNRHGSVEGRYYSTGSFNNKTLSGSNVYVEDCVLAGVYYEIEATRGVDAGVYLTIVY